MSEKQRVWNVGCEARKGSEAVAAIGSLRESEAAAWKPGPQQQRGHRKPRDP
jgi:hypothetical protein